MFASEQLEGVHFLKRQANLVQLNFISFAVIANDYHNYTYSLLGLLRVVVDITSGMI